MLELLRNDDLLLKVLEIKSKIKQANDINVDPKTKTKVKINGKIPMEYLLENNKDLIFDLIVYKNNASSRVSEYLELLKKYKSYCDAFIQFEREVNSQRDHEFELSKDLELSIPQDSNDYKDVVRRYNKLCQHNLGHVVRYNYEKMKKVVSDLEKQLEDISTFKSIVKENEETDMTNFYTYQEICITRLSEDFLPPSEMLEDFNRDSELLN